MIGILHPEDPRDASRRPRGADHGIHHIHLLKSLYGSGDGLAGFLYTTTESFYTTTGVVDLGVIHLGYWTRWSHAPRGAMDTSCPPMSP